MSELGYNWCYSTSFNIISNQKDPYLKLWFHLMKFGAILKFYDSYK